MLLMNDLNLFQQDLLLIFYDIKDFLICITLYEVMVEDNGIEPLTPCLQSRCSPS